MHTTSIPPVDSPPAAITAAQTTGMIIAFGRSIYFNDGMLSALGGCGNDCKNA